MNIFSKSLVLGTALLAVIAPSAVLAASSSDGPLFGYSPQGKWIIGAKVANVDPNIDEVRDADAKGIVLGYEFAKPVGDAGTSTVELEYITTDKTRVSLLDPFNRTYESDIVNLFFTYRSPGKLYFKVKGGLSYIDRTISGTPYGVLTNTGQALYGGEEVSLTAGFGFGFRINEYGVIEIEYSQDSSQLDTSILSVNALLQF